MLHSWYQGAALLVPGRCTFLVPFFQFVYRRYFQVPDLFIFREIDEIRLILHSTFFILHSSFSQQPQAVTLANPFRIPMHKKTKVKKSVSKTPCASVQSVSFF